MREKCPYWELFWSAYSRIWTEYGEIFFISPYSVRMRKIQTRITLNTPTFYVVCIEVVVSICTLSLLDMSDYLHRLDDRALKSSIIVGNASFLLHIAFMKTSELVRNFSNSYLDIIIVNLF